MEMVREPEKELEFAPVLKNWPAVVELPVTWIPSEMLTEPEKLEEPVP